MCNTLGQRDCHMKHSTGGESDVLNFYCTSNETAYGAHYAKFEPRVDRHKGAGYVPNNRVVLGYRGHMDEIDNPPMGKIVAQNYQTVAQRDYKAYATKTGGEQLPCKTFYAPTGFVREIAGELGDSETSAPMQTEYKGNFQGEPSTHNTTMKIPGPKEDSGYTLNTKIVEPVTNNPDNNYCGCGKTKDWMTNRPTSSTVYQTEYKPYTYDNGREPLSGIYCKVAADSGFDKGNKGKREFLEVDPVYGKVNDPSQLKDLRKNDLAEYFNTVYPNQFETMYNDAYKGPRNATESDAARLNRVSVGPNTKSGFTLNDDSYVQTRDQPQRFITHNMTTLYNPTLVGHERRGHVNFKVNPIQPDGFTKSTMITEFEPQMDAYLNQTGFDSYQARALGCNERVTGKITGTGK